MRTHDKIHVITSKKLTFSDIENIIFKNYRIELSEESRLRIQKCRNYLDEKMKSQNEPIYGISTGFGALHNHSISPEQSSQLQHNLITSHACSVGEELQPRTIRLMLFLKAHALSYGNSGVQLITVERIIDFINRGIYPVVHDQGSLGASGDLAPLANLFLPLIGQGEVRYHGKKYESREILEKFNWQPIDLQSKEGLALLNGTQFMASHGVLALLSAFKLSRLADIISAISLEAFDGRLDPFYESLHTLRPHKGQIETAKFFNKILQGSQLITRPKKHVQDPYSFRCIPQVHGASKDAINYVAGVLETEINSVTDNPTIFVDEDKILSGGNFHGQPLALAFDFLSIALSELGSISERRVYRLISGWRDLPEFLIAQPGLNSGFMIPQYVAASLVSQNKQLSTPTSIDSIPSSNEQEDHVSMGGNGAIRLLKVIQNLEKILAIELFNAAQALEFRRPLKTSDFLENFIEKYRNKVSFIENDVVMYKEIEKSVEFIKSFKQDI